MRTIIPILCGVAAVAALFTACSSDDSVNGNKGASAGDGSTSADGSITPKDGSVPGTDAGKVGDSGDSGDSADAAQDSGDAAGQDADIDASFDGSPPGDAGVDPTFTNVYGIIINGTCNGCHGAVMPSGKLNMSTQAAAYASLVNVASAGPACAVKAEPRVLPNDHANSLIWNKVNGTQNCGSRMPLGGGALSQEKVNLVAEWIDNGALND